jgi:hypothetical protein
METIDSKTDDRAMNKNVTLTEANKDAKAQKSKNTTILSTS